MEVTKIGGPREMTCYPCGGRAVAANKGPERCSGGQEGRQSFLSVAYVAEGDAQ